MEKYHRAVLPREVLDVLRVGPGKKCADVTFGEGGHTETFLGAGAAKVVAVDRDGEALRVYKESGAQRADPRLQLVHGRFSHFQELVPDRDFDAILADLGVSTRQLLRAERGFSFNKAGPLDMRMDPEAPRDLAGIFEDISADQLAKAFERLVDIKNAERFARRILEAYRAGKLKTTLDLAGMAGRRVGKAHPATVMFLLFRMLVNEEYEEVEEGLPKLVEALKPGGRLAVITFHSSEDRLVKRTFQKLAGGCVCELPGCVCPREKKVSLVLKKPMVPDASEMRDNPRSRSAKLRCVERLPLH